MPIKKFRRALTQFWSGRDKTKSTLPVFETLEDRWLMSANQVSGTVFADVNNDGVRQTGEAAVAGVQVALKGVTTYGDTISLLTTTDSNGNYLFDSLADGTYSVSDVPPSDYFDGKDTPGSAGGNGSTGLGSITGITLAKATTADGNNFGVLPPTKLSGYVYVDSNNNGAFDLYEGMAGEVVTLSGTDDLGAVVSRNATTDVNGKYTFASLRPGAYTITKGASTLGLMDAGAQVGTQGGVAGGSTISSINLTAGTDGKNNNFREGSYSMISGTVYVDYNLNGLRDTGELALAGVSITLSGFDDRGAAVSQTVLTNSGGVYQFLNLRPGNYTISEGPVQGYADGKATAGNAGGTATTNAINLSLGAGLTANKYNFSEVMLSPLAQKMTATASWWAGSKGQNLIKQLNGSASATALGNWLASTMPNLFGAGSPYATAGKTNTAIATMMVTLNKSTATALEANILALALNAYATSSTLAGNTKAAQAGFTVTPAGVGGYAYNVFGNGAVFGVANSLNVTVSQYLAAANAKSAKGVAWALDPSHRATAQSVLVTINAIGKIK